MKKYIVVLCDSQHGVHVPKVWIDKIDAAAWGVSEDDADILKAGADSELYWETWEHVLANAKFTDDDGRTWRLWQDGDLFAIADDAPDVMKSKFFGEW